MEITNSLSSIYLKHDYTPLKDIARAVLKLEVLFGAFRSFHAIGPLSRSVLNLMKELQPDDDSLSVDSIPSSLNRLILIDRSVDWVSPFTTSLTYESLIHEVPCDLGSAHFVGSGNGLWRRFIGGESNWKEGECRVDFVEHERRSLLRNRRFEHQHRSSVAEREMQRDRRYIFFHHHHYHPAFSKNRPISSDSSVSEIAAYAGKVGTISELKESLQIHLEVRFFPSKLIFFRSPVKSRPGRMLPPSASDGSASEKFWRVATHRTSLRVCSTVRSKPDHSSIVAPH
ncbi:uncharacterized protein [Blastocystis hominis]|uniref:Uncharacterized protein n=1 Tax=Blastocystis hominis TaxID=12968 RepID=D8M611_BLAHO|nr:uncharacterized protein [Blastocystis hominis]CBK23610.2 unnamed protein product [Blastocystis hominis]|eukprot:XP_012897658.1 uncharacterized protein [Blastocystis hominis]